MYNVTKPTISMQNNSTDQKNITDSTKPPAGTHMNILQEKKLHIDLS